MKKQSITGRIYTKVLDLLKQHPKGLHWSELIKEIQTYDPTLHPKTVNGCIWKLTQRFPDKVYKPEKGLFRLLEYKESD